ncbi:MAG: NFACT family protein [Clostridia bacterium]|nr:NFACT family protein [Clostridia bacterium]
MAFDGIFTSRMVEEIRSQLLLGKIDKVYQPQPEELVFVVHTKEGNLKLFASASSNASRIHLIDELPENPKAPYGFCMLMRKHLQGARIVDIRQKDSERIVEMDLETLNELGFNVSKRLVFEIMGRHSNITLLDVTSGKIIDSIKRVSIDVSRVRQLLPGMVYQYPPTQDKVPFKEVTEEFMEKVQDSLKEISGICPAFSHCLDDYPDSYGRLQDALVTSSPRVYRDKDFYSYPILDYEQAYEVIPFDTLSEAVDYYYQHKDSTNRIKQKSVGIVKSVSNASDKAMLKKQRLLEDIEKAKNSEDLRLYGELLTANLHLVKAGAKSVDLLNYYDGSTISVPLDERYSPAKNAQNYFKKYGKLKNSIKEKNLQLEMVEKDISYLQSVLSFLEDAKTPEEVDAIRQELVETGYIRKRKTTFKEKKFKAAPKKYVLDNGMEILVGKNNKENDHLTLKIADKKDLWFHTKDIPGSHVILRTFGKEVPDELIYTCASIAAFHSKAKDSSKVPVDYVPVKYVKKPQGAKPGMVIFTNNRTVYVDPKENVTD